MSGVQQSFGEAQYGALWVVDDHFLQEKTDGFWEELRVLRDVVFLSIAFSGYVWPPQGTRSIFGEMIASSFISDGSFASRILFAAILFFNWVVWKPFVIDD